MEDEGNRIIMYIRIKSIPAKDQRYPTCGDYWEESDGSNTVLEVRISEMKPDHEFLVMIHELIEYHLAKKRGIQMEDIDSFDRAFEELREGLPKLIGDQEPGDMVSAPYFKEHQFATKIERMVAEEMGVDWKGYENDVNSEN